MYDRSCNRTQTMRFYPVLFTGKERDQETGYGYFGARYMDHVFTTMWLSVDPMADKYPSISPYSYCAWNPVKLVDPNGKEYGDYYDISGNYLGWDGKNDDFVYIVGNKLDIRKIKRNDKESETTLVNDLESIPLLKTSYGVLREACNVLSRAEQNSGQTKEECSIVDLNSGLGIPGKTGELQTVDLPIIPDWISDAVSIHSHNKYNDATQMSVNHRDNSGDADQFGKFTQNVIVGPLGVGGEPGVCFYRKTSVKENPMYKMSLSVAKKIIGQQSFRKYWEIQSIIQDL